MAVIKDGARKVPFNRERRRPHFALRVLNVIFSSAVAVAFAGGAAYAVLGGVDGYLPERISSGFVAVTGFFGAFLIVRHAFRDANPISLILVMCVAAGFAAAIQFGAEQIFVENAQLSRLRRPIIIDAAVFYGAAYLMIWERGVRTDIGSDDIIDVFRSIFCIWPMFLYIILLVGIEFLVW
jgi:hypothetical protein